MWDMGEAPMRGGWQLSNVWTPMCGQGWAGTATSFIAMWAVMTAAMMLPSAAPALWRLRLGPRIVFAGAGYLSAWIALGAACGWAVTARSPARATRRCCLPSA